MQSKVYKTIAPIIFDEEHAPNWLTSKKSVKGSTMDQRWFWNDHILTMEIGQSIDTEFNCITRLT